MEKRLLEERHGRKVYVEEKDDKLFVHETQDISSALEYAKKMYNAVPQKSYRSELRKKNIVRLGAWPNIIIEKMMRETGKNLFSPDQDEFEAACKELETNYSAFKTAPGKYF